MKKLLRKFNLKLLKSDIESYGYKYSIKDFLLELIAVIAIIFTISYISQLKFEYMMVLIGFGVIIIPILTLAWYRQNYQMKRFKMLTDYLSNILPIFMQKAKVRYALEEVLDLTNSKMQKVIREAINYIDNNFDDVNVHKTALKLIEDEFPNSRLKSVHKLMLTIEEESSSNYHHVCENLYIDIENWIKRIYNFHKDLKSRRTKLILLCIMTLLLNCMFVYLYVTNEYFKGFTDVFLYQISTTTFIITIFIVITLIMTKLHGEWLVNDIYYSDDEKLKREYSYITKGIGKNKVIDIILMIISLLSAIFYLVIKENIMMSLILFIMAYLIINHKTLRVKKAYKIIEKALMIEFPIWLREISLSLNNLTVINSIEHSKDSVSYCLKEEIKEFIKDIKKDPTSIKPFTNFLLKYDIPDATSSMKVLYSIQNIGQEEVKEQISSLIIRNQEMLDKAEVMRNNDSISGIESIGYIPVIIFSIEMMCSMFVLFSHMMTKLSSVLVF